ncbi:MAG: hypothetical protein RMJ87_05170 [Cytophagales bacterium]|nr:hypothetical protein [Bernardetiaceae bacterium]MDW8204400.1 hypothetical protein [Cytophagales bacterium]
MNRYEHPFFNPEIKPALIVINLLMALLLPFFFIAGTLAALIKPLQTYFATGNWIETLLVVIVGLGFPILIVWSLFATWARFNKGQYKRAFIAAIYPIVFAGLAVLLWVLVVSIDWLVGLFFYE